MTYIQIQVVECIKKLIDENKVKSLNLKEETIYC